MQALEIPQDVIDEVVAALSQAIGLATAKEPRLRDGFLLTALRLDEAIKDALATQA